MDKRLAGRKTGTDGRC